ncbi:MAG: hsp70 family protein [Desulfamplus sp.]|nr:hsp70 family protein [Desulfamplus sp.]
MDFQDRRYVVGIDLGTTNSAVSYVDLTQLEEKNRIRAIKIFKIPQLISAGEFAAVSVLPSFLYIPGEYDISKESINHPWKREKDLFAGVLAREQGSLVPSRLVSSAKSWLCHARADRQAKILPWGSENIDKVSPVAATAEYLRHIKKAWNYSVKDEDDFLENQYVIITVPASFDEAAREFTLEAAREAGFGKHITLLEEPLAAFYSWLVAHEYDWQDYVRPDDLILVCDVGGGTTDFTLITLKEAQGSPRFERLAVGDHLILGGDNIDLALARFVESKFFKKKPLTADKWKTLCHKCRAAKEKILDRKVEIKTGQTVVPLQDDSGNKVRITIKGEGRSLIEGTLSADLTKSELENILCEGFFPDIDPSHNAVKTSGKAIAEFGLPYEQEPAITRHIAWFLEKHRDDILLTLGKLPMPDLILFNGGSLKPQLLQDRIRSAIRKWFSCDDTDLPGVLANPDPDLAVALGASYYGLVKQGAGVKVGSGSPRSYYIGISKSVQKNDRQDDLSDEIIAGGNSFDLKTSVNFNSQAICIVERGLDEGTIIELPKMEFEVITNQPVVFNIFSSSFRSGDKSGDILEIDDSLTLMTPLQTIIRFGKKGEKAYVPVKIEPEYTEMGTLAIWCRSCVTNHRWKLQFQLRDASLAEVKETEVLDATLVEDAIFFIDRVFTEGADSNLSLQMLVKNLEKKILLKRNEWPLSFLRAMADALIKNADLRKKSPEHEIRWLNLTGFCMRPGFGDALDQERIRHLWKIYLSGPVFSKCKQNSVEWWIFCRRIAGGLTAGQQRLFFQSVTLYLVADGNNRKRCSAQEMTEIWMAAANMERLIVKDKISLARKLISGIKPGKSSNQLFWALSRFGARELLYGSVDRVIPAKEVVDWVKKLFKIQWSKADPIVPTIAHIMRKTGDRTRDVSDDFINIVLVWLGQMRANEKYLEMLREVVPIESSEESMIYGESLPYGLVLKSINCDSDTY